MTRWGRFGGAVGDERAMLRRRPLESELEERIHPEDEPAFGLGGAPQIAETVEKLSKASTIRQANPPQPRSHGCGDLRRRA